MRDVDIVEASRSGIQHVQRGGDLERLLESKDLTPREKQLIRRRVRRRDPGGRDTRPPDDPRLKRAAERLRGGRS